MPKKNHVVAINEGVATSICIGNYLATGSLPCVYMQNSGLGNALNPLISAITLNYPILQTMAIPH